MTFITINVGVPDVETHRKLDQLLKNMSDAKQEILDAIAAERAEVLAKIEELINAAGISAADKDEIIAGVRGILTPEDAKPTAE